MVKPENLLEIRLAAKKRMMFLPHAVQQMTLPDRALEVGDILSAIDRGQIIEDYPEDARGSSSLILGPDHSGEPIHVVCAIRENYLAIVTAYRPLEKSGPKISEKGRKHEVRVLPGENEKGNYSVSY